MATHRSTFLKRTLFLGLVGSLTLGALMVGFPARADYPALPGTMFPGYTRPGFPASDETIDGKILFAGADEQDTKEGVGGTVYFVVLDLARGQEGDTWGTGNKGFDRMFVPGMDSAGASSPGLDTTARFLYLYQTVHDRNTSAAVQSTSVRLIVDPARISSWGHFTGNGFYSLDAKLGDAKEGGIRPAADEKAVGGIRPVSARNPVVSGAPPVKVYRDPDRAHPIDFLRIGAIADSKVIRERNAKGIKFTAAEEAALDPAKDPDSVVLVMADAELDHFPSVRALWNGDNVLKQGNRSCLFGFTSNLPPTIDAVRLRGIRLMTGGVRPAAEVTGASAVAAGIAPAGNVPTPIENVAAVAGVTPPMGTLGGMISGGGIGGFAAPPLAGAFTRPGFSTGSGLGEGGGNGGGGGQARNQNTATNNGQQQQQNVTPSTQTQTPSTLTQTVALTVVQQGAQQQQNVQTATQQQQQNQQQNQNQHQNHHRNQQHHKPRAVPEPSTYLLALFASPALFFFRLRKRVA